jgi:hypothetical protein
MVKKRANRLNVINGGVEEGVINHHGGILDAATKHQSAHVRNSGKFCIKSFNDFTFRCDINVYHAPLGAKEPVLLHYSI